MTEKRFYVDKSGDFRDTKTGNIIVDFGYSFNGMECKMILDLLNSLNDENGQLKQQLKSEHQQLENAILLERTQMGQSALKQYKEAIQ